MKVEVCNHFFEGREYFEFTLYDGPDGSERAHGYANDLIVAFTKVIEWRERIAQDYLELPPEEAGYTSDEGLRPSPDTNTNSETNRQRIERAQE